MSSPVTRHFSRCAGVQLHHRAAGSVDRPVLVLLHPSPKHSGMFEPWMRMLATHFHVLALDTPGYGASQAMATPPSALADYLGIVRAWLQSVADGPVALYGSATGAQLGIALANAHPRLVRHLFLDNAAHFDDEQRASILARYFPNLQPDAAGSHLSVAWRMAAQSLQYFPWFANDDLHRFSEREPTPGEIQDAMLEILNAGPHYDAAYRAAFDHERAAHVQALRVPTSLFRWQGSALLTHIDRLLSFPMPPQLTVVETPAPMPERLAVMTDHLRACCAVLP